MLAFDKGEQCSQNLTIPSNYFIKYFLFHVFLFCGTAIQTTHRTHMLVSDALTFLHIKKTYMALLILTNPPVKEDPQKRALYNLLD